jgi:LacI family gluconate utilization system Gnt-I transcriptional repressor
MKESGTASLPIEVVRDVGAIRIETGAEVLRKIMGSRPNVDAIFFTSDVFAVGAILEARALGLNVPERLGIAGFHDLEMGRLVSPTLTTVHVPALEIGRRAGELILNRLTGRPSPRAGRELPFRIVRRESTRRPL